MPTSLYQEDSDESDDMGPGQKYGYEQVEVDQEAYNNNANDDYRSVAERALSMLDDDYTSTMRLDGTKATTSTANPETTKIEKLPSLFSLPATEDEVATHRTDVSSDEIPAPERRHPIVDTNAVRSAVQAISLRDPTLARNTEQWHEHFQREVLQKAVLAPIHHAIIPKAPLQAFRRRTAKAIQATSNLTRSATLAEALYRILWSKPSSLDVAVVNIDRLIVHVVGVDHVECSSAQQTRTALGPLVRWIGASSMAPQRLELHLVGPNIPHSTTDSTGINLMPATLSHRSCLQHAEAFYHRATYHEWWSLQQEKSETPPDFPHLLVCFNPGLWGYDEWRPTLQLLCCDWQQSVPFVATAYTLQEAEDDWDVIRNMLSQVTDDSDDQIEGRCLWKVEANPFASKQTRPTATAVPGREYRENMAWHAWRLGRGNL